MHSCRFAIIDRYRRPVCTISLVWYSRVIILNNYIVCSNDSNRSESVHYNIIGENGFLKAQGQKNRNRQTGGGGAFGSYCHYFDRKRSVIIGFGMKNWSDSRKKEISPNGTLLYVRYFEYRAYLCFCAGSSGVYRWVEGGKFGFIWILNVNNVILFRNDIFQRHCTRKKE